MIHFAWPFANTAQSAAHFWGWLCCILAVLNFVVLGGFFLLDAMPYLTERSKGPAIFGLSFSFVGITTGVYALLHGVQMIDMKLTPTGPRPIDMLAIAGCFTPMLSFAWQRIRNLCDLPERYWSGTRIATILIAAAAFAAAFATRTIDVIRFYHYDLQWHTGVALNAALGLTYLIISAMWLRYQWSRRLRTGWNAIGSSLGLLFFQFAFTRFAVALLLAGGVYNEQSAGSTAFLVSDIASVVAAVVFLIVAITLLIGPSKPRPTSSRRPSPH